MTTTQAINVTIKIFGCKHLKWKSVPFPYLYAMECQECGLIRNLTYEETRAEDQYIAADIVELTEDNLIDVLIELGESLHPENKDR
tara:strand:+ start:9069 stop:9326 length:258 start_codon:yes stop_codon:yes gene_type:complete